jgi:hypothetical protein
LRQRNVVAAERSMHEVNAALGRLDELPSDGPESLSNGLFVRSRLVPPFSRALPARGDDVLMVRAMRSEMTSAKDRPRSTDV